MSEVAVVQQIDTLEAEGLGSTKRETLVELLPRPLPTSLTAEELAEYARRVRNLALFDFVSVTIDGRVLHVRVRRKATISPIVDFSSGKTLRDSKITLGLTENDLDGRGTRLGGWARYSERGLNFMLRLNQHPYGPRRWMNELEVFYAGSGFRFEGDSTTWHRNRFGGIVEWLSPFLYGHHWRYEVQTRVYRETYTYAESANALRSGTYVGVVSELIWDRYSWNDLTPNGLRITLEVMPGVFLGAAEARHEALIKALGALKLGEATAIVAFGKVAAVNGGNVNHSLLIGSQQGVRGLSDSLYRSARVGYANVELRHALSLGKRWYLQGVLFTDAARFQPMDARGDATPWVNAWSTGAGLRILPTALVDTLLRFDVARLHAPNGSWFYQLGITQYI